MLAAFVVGLREGAESALIVGIVCAALVARGRRDALRWVALGVAAAVASSLAVGIGLGVADAELPGHGQEVLETLVALLACAMVTYMVFWMRANGPSLRARIHAGADAALDGGSVPALVVMAFLAVVREGVETAMFLTALAQQASAPVASLGGAALGLAAAVVLGLVVARGGARIDISRFMRITGVVLVVVAAGLLATAVHTAAEAGLITALQEPVANLASVMHPGGLLAALVTGVFGIEPEPTAAEALAWMAYAIPLLAVVLWRRPTGRPAPS